MEADLNVHDESDSDDTIYWYYMAPCPCTRSQSTPSIGLMIKLSLLEVCSYDCEKKKEPQAKDTNTDELIDNFDLEKDVANSPTVDTTKDATIFGDTSDSGYDMGPSTLR